MTYNDNLCLFRCLALHRGCDVRRLETTVVTLYAKYTDIPVHDFAGVTIEDVHKVETKFKTNVVIYQLVKTPDGKTVAELVRRSPAQYPETMYVNLYEPHFSYIQDMKKFSHSYRCSKCENSMWKCPAWLERHELRCEAGVRHIYNGGVYHPPPSIFERLDEGVVVSDSLRFYPYRATFDLECFFTGDNLPADTNTLQWSARHIPLSVSVASNVPGHEDAQCYVTNGDSNKLVADMMVHLTAISDTAYDSLLPSCVDVLADLDARKQAWEEETKEAEEKDEEEEAENGKKTVNPYKTLENQLQVWLHQLPVVGFNCGRYDLNAIKRFFVPLLIHNNTTERASCFVIKRQNNSMCLSTDKLKFVDICNYLAPDKYLKA